MHLPITLITAGTMGLWFFVLTYRVIRSRQTASDSDADRTRIERRVRGHANFAEYTPLTLVLIGLAEFSGANVYVVWLGAILLISGRLLHGYTFAFMDFNRIGRVGGTLLTTLSLLFMSLANLWLAFAV